MEPSHKLLLGLGLAVAALAYVCGPLLIAGAAGWARVETAEQARARREAARQAEREQLIERSLAEAELDVREGRISEQEAAELRGELAESGELEPADEATAPEQAESVA